MTAKAIDALTVTELATMPDGVTVATVPCADYDALAALPRAIEVNGLELGRTGWNSDRCVAYYRTDAIFARPIR